MSIFPSKPVLGVILAKILVTDFSSSSTKNNVTIKLSRRYAKESLELALEFLHNNEFRDIKMIDARIKNQIILND